MRRLTVSTAARHVSDCGRVAQLLDQGASDRLRALYWYDLPLPYAVSWRGIARVLGHAATGRSTDPVAAQHGVSTLYSAAPSPRQGSAPTVWDCRSIASQPWWDSVSDVSRLLEENADRIRGEYAALRDRVQRHPDDSTLTSGGRWNALFLYGAGGRPNEAVCRLCPVTTDLVSSLPIARNFGFVMFSELAPGTHVKPHTGSSNLRLRCHLALIAPEPGRVTIRVGGETRTWIEGRAFAFDDSFEHEVHHRGDQARAILSLDIWHPSLSREDIDALSDPVFSRFGRIQANTAPTGARNGSPNGGGGAGRPIA